MQKLHLVGIYMTSITKMHGTMNIKLFIFCLYEGWNFNSGNYLFTTDTK